MTVIYQKKNQYYHENDKQKSNNPYVPLKNRQGLPYLLEKAPPSMRRISPACGTKKKHRPRICSEAPMRRLFPEPSAKENLCFSVQSDYISALARKVLFPNLPEQQAKLLFSFFQSSVQLVCFFIFLHFFIKGQLYHRNGSASDSDLEGNTHVRYTNGYVSSKHSHQSSKYLYVLDNSRRGQ